MKNIPSFISKVIANSPDWIKASLIWGFIFLPGLSSVEMDRNELRRALPAVTMLETCNWITPSLGGTEYYRKPPLINWMIASSFYLSGSRNAFQARLPIALSVLFTSLAFLLLPQRILPGKGRLAAALIFLTSAGIIDEGRTANIDPVFACSATLSVIFWLKGWYAHSRNRWILWLIPGLFVGSGLLLKGPLILLSYYAFLISFLSVQRRLREFLSPAHWVGLLLALAFVGVWYASVQHHADSQRAGLITSIWGNEMLQRMDLSRLNWGKWLTRSLGGVLIFFPWLLIALPGFSRTGRTTGNWNEEQLAFLKSALYAFFLPLILICLMPLTKARYSLPLIPVLSIVAAISLTHPYFNRTGIPLFWQKVFRASILLVSSICIFYTAFVAGIFLIAAIPTTALLRQQAACIASHINLWSLPVAIFSPIALLQILKFTKAPQSLNQLLLAAVAVTAVTFAPFKTAMAPLIRNPGITFAKVLDRTIPRKETLYAVGNAAIRSFSFYSGISVKPVQSFSVLRQPTGWLLFPQEMQNEFASYIELCDSQIVSAQTLEYKDEKYILANIQHQAR